MMKPLRSACGLLSVLAMGLASTPAQAQCRDTVVLVHGNTGTPADFDNTYNELLARGYAATDILRPDWGSKVCAGCNDHHGSEETPVRDAITQALARSCTGKIDVIAHSMGVTLAIQQVLGLGVQDRVEAFVGIAGAYRGLRSCGTYPLFVPTATCGAWGLSIRSPFLESIYGKRMARRIYSLKSNSDLIVCATGSCTVDGVHSSQIANEDASYTHDKDHFALVRETAVQQADLIHPNQDGAPASPAKASPAPAQK